MAGLLEQAIPAKKPQEKEPVTPAAKPMPAERGAKPVAGEQEQGGETPTAQEQETFDRIAYAAKIALYDEGTHEDFMAMLKQGEPAQALAQTAGTLFQQIDQKSGGKIPEDMILPAAEQVLDLVIEMAEKTGTMQIDETMAAKALQQMVLVLAQAYDFDPAEIQGEIDAMPPEQLQQIVQQQQQIEGA